MTRSTEMMIALILMIFAGMPDNSSADGEDLSVSAELLRQGDDLFNSEKIEDAVKVYIQAAETAESRGNKSDLTEAYSQVARCYLKLERIDEGRPWLEKAREKASPDDSSGWSRYLGVRGRFEWKDAAKLKGELSPETDRASNTFKEMHDYCLNHGLYERAIDAANMVSITGMKSERAIWAQKGIEAAETGNLESWLAPLWNNLGWAYDDLGRYDESLQALKKARVYHYKKGDELSMIIADWSVGHAYRMCGKIDSSETILRSVQKLAMIRKGEEKSPENAEWFGFANLELGELALRRGDRAEALKLFKVAYSNLHEAGMNEWDAKKFKELNDRILELARNK